jgi:hypothetical protein
VAGAERSSARKRAAELHPSSALPSISTGWIGSSEISFVFWPQSCALRQPRTLHLANIAHHKKARAVLGEDGVTVTT